MLRPTYSMLAKASHCAIIGGGTVGCAVAAQLAMAGNRVTLIEAGPNVLTKPDWHTEAPASLYIHRLKNTGYQATDCVTSPQHGVNSSRAATPLLMPYPHVLGGSGIMGGRSWFFGLRQDYDYSNTEGSDGDEQKTNNKPSSTLPWDSHTFIEARRKWEAPSNEALPHRGRGGRFVTGRPAMTNRMYKPFSETLMYHHMAFITEFNPQSAAVTRGAGRPEVAINPKTHRSETTLRELRQSLMLRRPIDIKADTRAVQLVKGKGKENKVGGVAVVDGKGQESIFNCDEVILAAGPVPNAQILLRSAEELGGPSDPLLPLTSIGKNFFDSPHVVLQYASHSGETLHAYLSSLTQVLALQSWRMGDANVLCSGYDDMTILYSSEGPRGIPDVRITLQPFAMSNTGAIPAGAEQGGVQFVLQLLRPRSRGYVTVDAVNPAYYSDPTDRSVMQSAVDYIQSVAASDRLREFFHGAKTPLVTLDEAGCRGGGTLSAATKDGVVDPTTFRVKGGLTNLFAADSSILPAPISGDYSPLSVTMAELFVDAFLGRHLVAAAPATSGSARPGTFFGADVEEPGTSSEGSGAREATKAAGNDVKVTYY